VDIPAVEGLLTTDDLVRSGQTIVDLQLESGMIEWYPGGHADPWNHVETAMALTTVGFLDQAEKAYQWLIDIQLPNGAWHNYYLADGIEDSKFDTNCIAYFATGVWHHYLATGDAGFLEHCWPTVDAAIEFVVGLQRPRGEIIWAQRADGDPWSYALLTGSSSISHSLYCASLVARVVGKERDHWQQARLRLANVVANHPDAFEPKDRWAMDWYYPVLTGAVTGDDARKRLSDQWDTFVMDGKGVRCVSDRPWVTAAETCECVIALLAAGEDDQARQLFAWAQRLRADDGAYFTGLVFPELVHFPADERSAYTAAAVILAADALFGTNPTSPLFTEHETIDLR
jgi:hypothetical protein